MEVWRGQLGSAGGTLWVVPHLVDSESVEAIERYLQASGPESASDVIGPRAVPREVDCVLVDEIGFLLELYSEAAWVYVGGGFGVSTHSTIEPALLGLPIACGPEGEKRFQEITQLQATGQLEVVRDGEMLARWVGTLASRGEGMRERWKAQARGRLGASKAVLEAIRRAIAAKPRRP